jgi:hypothetical protein
MPRGRTPNFCMFPTTFLVEPSDPDVFLHDPSESLCHIERRVAQRTHFVAHDALPAVRENGEIKPVELKSGDLAHIHPRVRPE